MITRRDLIDPMSQLARRVIKDERGQFILRQPVAPPPPVGEPLFRMVTNSGTYPECGFDVADDPTNDVPFTRTLVTNGTGPGGRNFVRFDFTPTGTLVAGAWGWALEHATWFALDSCVQGDIRYYRFSLKIFSPLNWAPTSGGNPGTKFIDYANQGDTLNFPTRSVLQLFSDRVNTEMDIYLYRGGGGGYGPRLNNIALDTWHNVQCKLQSGSTAVSNDAGIYLYMNAANNSESTPTMSVVGPQSGPPEDPIFNWNTQGWPGGSNPDSLIIIGSIIDSLGLGRSLSFGFTDFEYDDQFDTNWNNPALRL